MVEFFWTMLDAQAVNQHSLTALILALEFTIVTTLTMLELGAQVCNSDTTASSLSIYISIKGDRTAKFTI